mgnify:CR=1 FL=1
MMAIYGEAGMIGVCGALLVYLVMSLSKKSEKQQESLKNLEVENKGRYEQTMEAISDLEKQLSRMDGIMSRMNGNGRH